MKTAATLQPTNERGSSLKTGGFAASRGKKVIPTRVVLFGPPGVGKGTVAELLSAQTGACHLSTGDILRAASSLDPSERSATLEKALDHMRRGELVPDEIVLCLVREQTDCLHAKGGFLLDGFPRTITQAEGLEKLLREEHLDLIGVLDFELSHDEIIKRLAGRRICPNGHGTYHITAKPPRVPGICDVCGEKLIQREDDRPEAVAVRLRTYQESTAPLIDYYRKRGLLISISAQGTPQNVYERTMKAVESVAKKIVSENRAGIV